MIRLLERGVPTGPISYAFDVTQRTVKELVATIRVHQYGSSEIAELLSSLMFEAYEEAKRSLRHGNPAVKARTINMVLSKAMALVGKQSPEEFERMRAEVLSMFGDISTKQSDIPSMYADPTYSPSGSEDVGVADDA